MGEEHGTRPNHRYILFLCLIDDFNILVVNWRVDQIAVVIQVGIESGLSVIAENASLRIIAFSPDVIWMGFRHVLNRKRLPPKVLFPGGSLIDAILLGLRCALELRRFVRSVAEGLIARMSASAEGESATITRTNRHGRT